MSDAAEEPRQQSDRLTKFKEKYTKTMQIFCELLDDMLLDVDEDLLYNAKVLMEKVDESLKDRFRARFCHDKTLLADMDAFLINHYRNRDPWYSLTPSELERQRAEEEEQD